MGFPAISGQRVRKSLVVEWKCIWIHKTSLHEVPGNRQCQVVGQMSLLDLLHASSVHAQLPQGQHSLEASLHSKIIELLQKTAHHYHYRHMFQCSSKLASSSDCSQWYQEDKSSFGYVITCRTSGYGMSGYIADINESANQEISAWSRFSEYWFTLASEALRCCVLSSLLVLAPDC